MAGAGLRWCACSVPGGGVECLSGIEIQVLACGEDESSPLSLPLFLQRLRVPLLPAEVGLSLSRCCPLPPCPHLLHGNGIAVIKKALSNTEKTRGNLCLKFLRWRISVPLLQPCYLPFTTLLRVGGHV